MRCSNCQKFINQCDRHPVYLQLINSKVAFTTKVIDRRLWSNEYQFSTSELEGDEYETRTSHNGKFGSRHGGKRITLLSKMYFK